MDVWAISDLHLGPGGGKGHFSSKWIDHQPKMRAAWDKQVPAGAVILMPGDFSWNQHPEDLWYDYGWIDHRPGTLKVMTGGNHDYGVWKSREDVHGFCEQFESLSPLLGEAMRIDNPLGPDAPGMIVAGTIGSMTPDDRYYESTGGWSKKNALSDEALLVRELHRLERALADAQRLRRDGDALVMMLHYPPFADQRKPNVYAQVMEAAGVDVCLYGHLHQKRQWPSVRQGVFGGIDYRFVGADFLEWKPIRLGRFTEKGFVVDRIRRHAVLYWKWAESDKKWDGWIDTHDPKRVPDTEVVRGTHRATEPPPTSEDWDLNSHHFGLRLTDFDPVGLFVGFPDRIRDRDGHCRAEELVGPFSEAYKRTRRAGSREDRAPERTRATADTGAADQPGTPTRLTTFAGLDVLTRAAALNAMRRAADRTLSRPRNGTDGSGNQDESHSSEPSPRRRSGRSQIDRETLQRLIEGDPGSKHEPTAAEIEELGRRRRHIPTAAEIIARLESGSTDEASEEYEVIGVEHVGADGADTVDELRSPKSDEPEWDETPTCEFEIPS